MAVLKWINDNRDWVFSGIGVFIIATVWAIIRRRSAAGGVHQSLRSGKASQNIQAGRDVNIFRPTGAADSAASSTIFNDLERSLSDLLGVLRTELKDHPLVREFFVVPSSFIPVNSTIVRFRLNANEIPDLANKVHILENHRLVVDVTTGNTPLYRMTEDFVKYLTVPR